MVLRIDFFMSVLHWLGKGDCRDARCVRVAGGRKPCGMHGLSHQSLHAPANYVDAHRNATGPSRVRGRPTVAINM
jgi:hypothetical protein